MRADLRRRLSARPRWETILLSTGKYWYSAETDQCDYYQTGEYIYPLTDSTGRRPVIYIRDKKDYSTNGQALYYYY